MARDFGADPGRVDGQQHVLLASRAAFAENKETGKALNEFFEAEWNYQMEQSPARASST